jgi:VIT1/CCC1 family predicted Fe2+/Mn2+ transporter
MKHSIKIGLSFGMMSGVITTLGLMVGLYTGTQSRITVMGGIIIIALSDAFSDALGIHISEESENAHSPREIWAATAATFISKFLFSMIFILPVIRLDFSHAIIVSILMGCVFITTFSFFLARQQRISPWKVILEHLAVVVTVLVLTYNIGGWVSRNF